MKNFLIFLVMILMALPALAQRRPHPRPHPRGPTHRPMPRPMPRPIPNRSCQVVMVDRYNRVMNRYFGYEDPRFQMCRSALRDCSFDLRRFPNNYARCAQVRNW